MVVVQQRFSVDARTHVVVRQTEKVDFQSTGSEPLALQARVVQWQMSDETPMADAALAISVKRSAICALSEWCFGTMRCAG